MLRGPIIQSGCICCWTKFCCYRSSTERLACSHLQLGQSRSGEQCRRPSRSSGLFVSPISASSSLSLCQADRTSWYCSQEFIGPSQRKPQAGGEIVSSSRAESNALLLMLLLAKVTRSNFSRKGTVVFHTSVFEEECGDRSINTFTLRDMELASPPL